MIDSSVPRSGSTVLKEYSGLGSSPLVNSTQTCVSSSVHPTDPTSNSVVIPSMSTGSPGVKVVEAWSWSKICRFSLTRGPLPRPLSLPKMDRRHRSSPSRLRDVGVNKALASMVMSVGTPGIGFGASSSQSKPVANTPGMGEIMGHNEKHLDLLKFGREFVSKVCVIWMFCLVCILCLYVFLVWRHPFTQKHKHRGTNINYNT